MSAASSIAFPIELLPPLTKNAIQEVYANIQAPLPLIFSSAMGAVSLACQSVLDVRRPNGLESPCSLFLLVIAESGERKSTVDKYFKKPIYDFEHEQMLNHQRAQLKYEAEHLGWEAEKMAILSAIKKNAKKEISNDFLKARLADHTEAKPEKPSRLKLIYLDATPEALRHGLHANGRSAGIISAEANSVFGGRAMNDLAMLNDMWGGEPLHVARRSSDCFEVREPRLTLSLMIQPQPLSQHLNKHEGQARGIGFLARCLTAFPTSTQGSRVAENRAHSWQYVPMFQDRMTEILTNYQQKETSKLILEFSSAAQSRWVEAHNNVERDMSPGQYLAEIKDFAAKFSENVARLAALFHFFERTVGDISLDTTNRAIQICSWYMNEFKRLFGDGGAISADSTDAAQLECWLRTAVAGHGMDHVSKTRILQYAPPSLRKVGRLDPALSRLMAEGKIRIWPVNNVMYVHLAPMHFGGQPHVGASRWR